VIEHYAESEPIESICDTGKGIAMGLANGTILVRLRNNKTQLHDIKKEYKVHSNIVNKLLYLGKQKYLVSGSGSAIDIFSLPEGKSMKTISNYGEPVTSLCSINKKTFISAGTRNIFIWSSNQDFQNLKTICVNNLDSTLLRTLSNGYMMSISREEFKIWEDKSYNNLKTYKEDSAIRLLIETNNKYIITSTVNNEVNVWKVDL